MNIFYIWVALFLYLFWVVLCTRFALCKFFFSFSLLFSFFPLRALAWKKCRPRQRFCAGALFHVFARRLAYIFTSLQSLMPTFSRLCIQQNTNYTCCEKEGYPLLPSKMIFVPSLVVPPKNSHQPWPFRCLASDPNPSSTIQLHCTLSKQLFKRFREFRRLCRHLRRSYQGRHQSSSTQDHIPPRGNTDDY